MIFWKSCDKVRKYHSFKSYDEYTYITERNFKYSGVDQELSQYLRPWQPESSVLHLVQSNKRINDHDSDCIPLSIPRVGRPSQVASLHPKSHHKITQYYGRCEVRLFILLLQVHVAFYQFLQRFERTEPRSLDLIQSFAIKCNYYGLPGI